MFRFAHPELLYLLIVIPLLIVFYVVMIRRKKKAIAEFGNPELLGPLMPLLSFKRGTWKFVMLMLALLFVIVGVAGPQFGSKLQQVKKKGVELMIALDVSNSMMAQDIKPSRLEKAKMAISRALFQHKCLIAKAGSHIDIVDGNNNQDTFLGQLPQ